MKQWIYKWLPIIFGCHCREDRSFYYKGKKFPLCARCTGELLGIITSFLTYSVVHPSVPLAALLMIPLIIDGLVQLKTAYESTNPRRLITGILFGYGLASIFIFTSVKTFLFGYHFMD